MALRKLINIEGEAFVTTPNGQINLGVQKTAFTAYCKIVSISGNKESGSATIRCAADNYEMNQQFPVKFSVEENAPNFIKQAYEEIKKLPDWADAVDC